MIKGGKMMVRRLCGIDDMQLPEKIKTIFSP